MVGLPEEFRKESVKNYPILFRCAKRSILPNKTETSEKRNPKFLWSKFHSTKSQNGVIFLLTLLLVFFWQSDHRFLHSRGAVLWLGQNQNIMLDNFEIFQKVMAFQKMNTKD
ncbi:hypothetical protein DW068_12810 [Anaerobutyricum hallii]|uniref:Uncharacterized protein n=1 Tax=Anaerobutyricum hallii TaxID=39488 RepID=A0A415G4V1_9FIRM|nr:hypothetical protein DW068_12810 [Anaerobutyricum hallii]